MANYLIGLMNYAEKSTIIAYAKKRIETLNTKAVKGLEEVMNYTKGPVRIFNQEEISDNWKDYIEFIKKTNKPYPRD